MTYEKGQPARHPLLYIEKVQSERTFRLVGELDFSNANWLQTALHAEARKQGDLILDLALLEFIDCSGRQALVSIAALLKPRGRLIVRNPTAIVRRLFDLTDMHSVCNLSIHRTIALEGTAMETSHSIELGDSKRAHSWGLSAAG